MRESCAKPVIRATLRVLSSLQNSFRRVFSANMHEKSLFFTNIGSKNFKKHFHPDPTRFPGPQINDCPGKDLSHFRHGNLTPDRGIKCRNKSTKSTKSAFMSDIMARTMVTGFKRLPQSVCLGGNTSRFGSKRHISNSLHFLA